MRWLNKGKEFDEYRLYFEKRKILIYGAGDRGKYTFKRLNVLDCVQGFVDNAPELIESGCCGKEVIAYNFLKENVAEKFIIVIAAKIEYALEFAIQCRKVGFIDGKTLFYWEDFLKYYYDLYAWFHNGKVCADFLSLQITSVCNLRCEGCLTFTPYNKHMHHFKWDDIKKNIDALFSNIDYVRTLDLCGGEPFLLPIFHHVIEYVGSRYRNRIEYLRTVSNGTIIPTDEVCQAMAKNRMLVLLDDYRETVKLSQDNYEKVYNKLIENKISVITNKVDKWIDLGITGGKKIKDKCQTVRLYDECNNTRFAMLNMKLYSCDYAAYASESGVYFENNSDYLDFRFTYKKEVILEYLKGYTDTGCSGMCQFCNGAAEINRCFIGVANQLENKY